MEGHLREEDEVGTGGLGVLAQGGEGGFESGRVVVGCSVRGVMPASSAS